MSWSLFKIGRRLSLFVHFDGAFGGVSLLLLLIMVFKIQYQYLLTINRHLKVLSKNGQYHVLVKCSGDFKKNTTLKVFSS